MLPDKIFKSLSHQYSDFQKHLNGQALEVGYKPDYVLKQNDEYIILESENSSSRKTYVGGMMKAAHFLQGKKNGKLIFIIVPKENTKAISIANHLKPYLKWISDKTNLRDVYIIEASQYYCNNRILALDGPDFLSCALKV